MKDNSIDGHRGKVAIDDTKLQSPDSGKADCVSGQGATNFDDDYNEWELGIGDLIIDLDADIEKNNEKNSTQHQNGNLSLSSGGNGNINVPGVNLNPLSGQVTASGVMSNPKSSRMGSGNGGSGTDTCPNAAAVEHQATVDKGLKMKIKRKNIGSKYSEAKHEIVQSDTKANSPRGSVPDPANANQGTPSESKSKHSSSKGRSSGHRDKKEKNRDKEKEKDKSKVVEVNGVIPSPANIIVSSASLKITNSGVNILSPTVQLGVPTGLIVANTGSNTISSTTSSTTSTTTSSVSTTTTTVTTTTTSSHEQCNTVASSVPTTNCNTSMSNLTVKLESKFSPGQTANASVILKMDELPKSPPVKRVKVENLELMDSEDSSNPTEFKESSTCTSIGTITEPECLGPCEPGTSVLLEGIVWQETEGGVLVVNVTWRGKTYVGTLLDCTKHDWAPPRFCESPTSDMDTKAVKGRGKRGRGSASASSEATGNTPESRTCVQSKLRNGKGRRNPPNSSNSGFTVPSSPARNENILSTKRKTRPIDLELSPAALSEGKGAKRSRSQSRNPPTLCNNVEFPQPSSPLLIECPEPNCSKKYKHINGLRYHQTHAHSMNESGRIEDMNLDECKDTTNSSDNEESMHEGASIPTSPVTPFARSASPVVRPLQTAINPPTLTPNSCSGDVDTFISDLSTLASVAISESATPVKSSSPVICFSSVASTPCINVPTDSSKQTTVLTNKPTPTTTSLLTKPVPSVVVTQNNSSLQISVPLSSPNSVIQSNGSVVIASTGSPLHSTPSVTVSIPTLHVMSFNQTTPTTNVMSTPSNSLPGSTTTTTTTSSAIRSAPLMSSSTVIAPVVASLTSTGVTVPLSIDKSKLKQEKLDRHKTLSSSSVRPVLAVTTNIPPAQASATGLASSLKPIQPKPTILGEPVTLNPALESLKREKSKHKKKIKDKDRKLSGMMVDGKHHSQCADGERMDQMTYHISENMASSRENVGSTLGGTNQSSASLSNGTSRSLDLRVESNASENSMNENVQSPAYSDISDANDTAPILESEVPSEKEKDEKTLKQTSETTQSPSSNLPYGMYSYYGQPPYLIPSVPPQSTPSPSATNGERNDQNKKLESERHKEIKVWSAQAEIEKVNSEQKPVEKKASREEATVSSGNVPAAPSSNAPLQDFSMQQSYSYPYGYMQGYPYGVDPAYHMHLLANDPHYKQQHERLLEEQLYKEQTERRGANQQPQNPQKDEHSLMESSERNVPTIAEMGKRNSPASAIHTNRDRENPPTSLSSTTVKLENAPSIHSPVTSLKEKQSENHQILKENIELKSQMDSAKANFSHYEAAAIIERQREEMRRYLLLHDHLLEQQQKMEPEPQPRQAPFNEPHSRKDGMSTSSSKNSILETRASNCVSPLKSDMSKTLFSANAISSSPKGSVRESHSSKDLPHISSTVHSSSKKDTGNSISSKISESTESKDDKAKSEKSKIQSEGQKPTMETTGPPPPPTNSYAYLHPSYLQAPPPHFAPMAFDHGHPMYRGGISPIIMSAAPPYGSSPYLHQQLRYHVPTGPCELAHHPQPGPDPLTQKLHAPGPPKALDLLHQVSQHYTTHKIHELQERALMSPTSSAASAPTSTAGVPHGKGSELPIGSAKQEANSSTDRNRSPPPQRHLHTHHHTHVGVGYPLYDPYGVNQQWKQAQAQRRVPFRLTH